MKRHIEISTPQKARVQFDKLEQWFASQKTQSMSFGEVEIAEEKYGRQLLQCLLQEYIDHRGSGDVGNAILVSDKNNGQGIVYSHRRIQARNVICLFGKIVVRRVGYGMPGKESIHPLDKTMRLPRCVYSYEIQRRLLKWAVQGPFDEAIETMRDTSEISIPKRIAESVVIDASADFNDFYKTREYLKGNQGGPLLIASIDCKGIPMIKSSLSIKQVRRKKGQKPQKKKMATVASVHTQGRRRRSPEDVIVSLFDPEKKVDRKKNYCKPEKKRVWASLDAGKEAFIKDVEEEMSWRDTDGKKIRILVMDGERALKKRSEQIIKNVVMILDFIHVLEKLWDVGHALYGEGTDDAQVFVRKKSLCVLQGGVGQVVKGIRLIVTKRKLKGKKEKTLTSTANYMYSNRFRMKYHEYLSEGYPIASGYVEGACKNLIKDRMERSGMRWSWDMAEAMVKMRATYLSGDMDEYWAYHIDKEQERLHPKGQWSPVKASS